MNATRRNRKGLDIPSSDEVAEYCRIAPVGPASLAIGALSERKDLLIFTKGQFSILDALRAVIAQTGPADVTLSTWTFGLRDMEMAAWLVSEGNSIRSFTFLVDASFPTNERLYAERLVALFGQSCMVLSKVHMKVAMVRNEGWDILINSSMNLNRNPRWEAFTLHHSPDFCDAYQAIVEELRARTGSGFETDSRKVDAVFREIGEGRNETEERLLKWLDTHGDDVQEAEPPPVVAAASPAVPSPPRPPGSRRYWERW